MATPALATRQCRPMDGQAALSQAEIEAHLPLVPGWAVHDGALEKRFEFADFHATMRFVDAVARIAHAQDHHPELVVTYGRCVVRYDTHAVGGLSVNDFICAARVEALPP